MTSPQHNRRMSPVPMVGAFPTPGEEVRLAYRELHIAVNGSEEQKKALGNHALLPRPCDRATPHTTTQHHSSGLLRAAAAAWNALNPDA